MKTDRFHRSCKNRHLYYTITSQANKFLKILADLESYPATLFDRVSLLSIRDRRALSFIFGVDWVRLHGYYSLVYQSLTI